MSLIELYCQSCWKIVGAYAVFAIAGIAVAMAGHIFAGQVVVGLGTIIVFGGSLIHLLLRRSGDRSTS